jgi:hypothetical protein
MTCFPDTDDAADGPAPRFIGGRMVKTSRVSSRSRRNESNGSGCSFSIDSITGSDVAFEARRSARSRVERTRRETCENTGVSERA